MWSTAVLPEPSHRPTLMIVYTFHMQVSAIVVAAGKGERFGSFKQVQPLVGIPLLEHSLMAFQRHPRVDEVVLVLARDLMSGADRWKERYSKLRQVVEGGETRGASVRQGLKRSQGEWILVHDAARPLVRQTLIDRVLERLERHPVVVPVLPVPDTVKYWRGDHLEGQVNRSELALVQTPQGVWRRILERAYEKAGDQAIHFSDESNLVEHALGIQASPVPGDPENLKVTFPEDLQRVEALMMRRLCVGFGYDRHRLTPDRPLFLGGVRIPSDLGALGHSDADVVIHALVDAMLGASGLGDIGALFPDHDPQWKNAPSRLFLEHARTLLDRHGYRVLHVDLTVLLERPRILPHVPRIRQNLARLLDLPEHHISIKGKSGEGIGPVGQREILEAYAVVTLLGPLE